MLCLTDNGLAPAMDACKAGVRLLCGKNPVLDAKDAMLELQARWLPGGSRSHTTVVFLSEAVGGECIAGARQTLYGVSRTARCP